MPRYSLPLEFYAAPEPTEPDNSTDGSIICEYIPNNGRNAVANTLKEAKKFITAYDTEHHLFDLWGMNAGIDTHKMNFSSDHLPDEIRLSSTEEAKDYLYSVRDSDWFKAAFHPILTGFDFGVEFNPKMGASAHFKYKRNSLRLGNFDATKTLFDPSSSDPVKHFSGCKRCQGSGFYCFGDEYEYCGKTYPCKKHDYTSENQAPCDGVLLQGKKIINSYRPGGKIEYGKVTGFTRSKPVLLHELAHVVTPFGTTPATAHGPEFLGSLSYILRNALGEESYEAFRRGTREQIKPRSLGAFSLDALPADFVNHTTEDAAAIKGQKRVVTPTRQKVLDTQRKKREKAKQRKDDFDPFDMFFGKF